MTICDICESRNPDYPNANIAISAGTRGVEAYNKHLDVCAACYSNIVRKIEELCKPLPKVSNASMR